MGVYIKGMEMPENCDNCDFMQAMGEYCEPVCMQGVFIECPTRRPPDCPLIELPPHGRLIDADALSSKLTDLAECEWNQSTGTTWAEAFEEVDGFVQDAPTIIEAEGRET